MSASPARAAAFDILMRVAGDAYASELLHSRHLDALTSADRALATELVMGSLRWQSRLDKGIAAALAQPLAKLDLEVLIAIRLGAYQFVFLDRVPARAAVNESVELVKRARKRSAAPLVNAVLRKLAVEPPLLCPGPLVAPFTAEKLARFYAHPLWLVERWTSRFGVDNARRICEYNQRAPATALRLPQDHVSHSSAKPARQVTPRESVLDELRAEGTELAPGALLASAARVTAGDVTRTRAFREGRVHIQDEASQLVAALVGGSPSSSRVTTLLDCCAAPGSKTAALAERYPQAHIVAVELHPQRARLLRRLTHAQNVRVIAADARALPFTTRFDRVLADVPCTGTGTLARNPEIKWRLRPEDLADLRARQLAILRAAMEHVADGGRLVYATCSLEREENEDVVSEALAGRTGFRLLDARAELEHLHAAGELTVSDADTLVSDAFLRTLPGVQPCDGFFAAVMERA